MQGRTREAVRKLKKKIVGMERKNRIKIDSYGREIIKNVHINKGRIAGERKKEILYMEK